MSRYDDQILDEFGRPVPGVSIYVYDDAGAVDTLTDDLAQPLNNPLTSDANGIFYFNASDGEKLLDFRYGGRTRYKQEIQVGNPAGVSGVNEQVIALSDEETAITAGAGKLTMHWPFDYLVDEVFIGLSVVSSAGAVTVDMNVAGVSIFTTRPSIDVGEETSLTGTVAVLDPTKVNIAKGAKVTFDFDAAGANAKGAKVYVIGRRV
jgi:hypothetical protein